PESFNAVPVYSKVFSVPSADFTTTVFVPSSTFSMVPFVTFMPSLPTFPMALAVSSAPFPVERTTTSEPSLIPSNPSFVPFTVSALATFTVCSVPSLVFTTTVLVPLSTFCTVPWIKLTTSWATPIDAANASPASASNTFFICGYLLRGPHDCTLSEAIISVLSNCSMLSPRPHDPVLSRASRRFPQLDPVCFRIHDPGKPPLASHSPPGWDRSTRPRLAASPAAHPGLPRENSA